MNKKQKIINLLLITILIIIDQILKITYVVNSQNTLEKTVDNMSYILINIIAIIVLVKYITNDNQFIKMDSKVILSFAIAGVISNMIDRIWTKSVINNIKIPSFTNINLSYIYITITWVGMAVILTKYSINRIKEKKKK